MIKKYLPPEHLEEIERAGLVSLYGGHYVTPCIDERACVFVTYEQGIARCSFEKAYLSGEIPWRKPLSCHLFPLRIDSLPQPRVRFEYIHECAPAIERGTMTQTTLADFSKDSLTRQYGDVWYSRFRRECGERKNGQKEDFRL